MNKILISSISLLLTLSLTACGVSEVRSAKPRLISSDVTPNETAALVQGNSEFAFDLYHELATKNGNLFFSPQSVSTALAMTYAGARGETEKQMAQTLHFALPQEKLHSAFGSLDLALNSRGQGAKGKDDGPFRLNMVNAIWGQTGEDFKSEFIDIMAENYGAGLRTLDFAKNPESARVTINNWVRGQTENRINNLVPPEGIDGSTVLVLTNAVYFNAAWLYPFMRVPTKNETFYLTDGKQVTVPMMRQIATLPYAERKGYQAVELPYDGREISMIIILPAAGNFSDFEKDFQARDLDEVVKSFKDGEVSLALPRFEFASDVKLKDTLSRMGMPHAFGQADFSGITAKTRIWIDEIYHKSYVAVNEKGTEAAAATAVVMQKFSASNPVNVTCNRPFIFLIRDVKTGAILFLGRVTSPLP